MGNVDRVMAVAVAVLAAACGSKPPPAPAPPLPRVSLPVLTARVPQETVPDDVFVVTVDAEGGVYAGAERVTLDGLGTRLRQRFGDGAPASSPPVARLRADRAAPWRHVQWALTILDEQGVRRVLFAFDTAERQAAALAWTRPTWEETMVLGPPDARVLLLTVQGGAGGDTFESALAEAVIRSSKKEAAAAVARIGVPLAPWGSVAHVFARLREGGIGQIELGYSVPDEALRALDRLPSPGPPYTAPLRAKLELRDAFRNGDRYVVPEEEVLEEPEPEVPEDDGGK